MPSGVSSLSVGATGEDSGPEEKSRSYGFRGVVKEGSLYGEVGRFFAGLLKRKGFPFGSLKEGNVLLLGESNVVWGPFSAVR